MFYALVPEWMEGEGIERDDRVHHVRGCVWGFAYQVPVGRLSDRFDRRLVLAVLSVGPAIASFVVVQYGPQEQSLLEASAASPPAACATKSLATSCRATLTFIRDREARSYGERAVASILYERLLLGTLFLLPL
jgi:hypothetical protein